MITVLIADDEKHARDRLKNLLKNYKNFSIIAEAKNGDEVIQTIISKKPDVAFLDINMPGVSVFDTIPSLKNPPLIIFQTAYSEYAVDAFKANALDYIMKPVSEERLSNTIDKIVKSINNRQLCDEDNEDKNTDKQELKKISVKTSGTIKVIDINDIYKISFEDGFSFIYTDEGRFLSDYYLNYFEEKLINKGFYRVSRNDIVNIKFISLIHPMFKGNYIIELKNTEKIKLSRRRAKDLKKIISF